MKKAVLYARVSSLLQKKEGTIESQINALREQIAGDGNLLVMEYVDDGYSGARLDRPALDELREDLKTDKFDTIYFWNTDRIARDVAYQTIIIAEILKYQKQIIINGKDYVHNPENKFALTVLGAVSELERAKILERIMRGKKHKLRSGVALNNGMNIFGYDYIKKTDEEPGHFVINEKEANIVSHIFNEYVHGASWNKIVRGLAENKMINKSGSPYWQVENVRSLINRHSYTGIKYYNTCYHSKKHSDPLKKLKYGKKIYRDKSEWIAVPFPQIIPKELFDRAQKRLEESRKKYRKPGETQLLSGLVICDQCGRTCVSYQRYLRMYYKYKGELKKRSENVHHKVAYRCSLKYRNRVHGKSASVVQCGTSEISAKILEPIVFEMVKKYMTKPELLKPCLQYSSNDVIQQRAKIKAETKRLTGLTEEYREKKKYYLKQYTDAKIDRNEYSKECRKLDDRIVFLELEKGQITTNIPCELDEELIDTSLSMYCESVKARLKHCLTSDKKRKLLRDYLSHVSFDKDVTNVSGALSVGNEKIIFKIVQNRKQSERQKDSR